MTITINGSGTVTGANTLTNTNTVTSAAATALTLQSAGTTAVTIDTSQNVGVGTASPGARLELTKSSAVVLRLNDLSTNYWDIENNSNLMFSRAGIERARIDISGRLLAGYNTSININASLQGFSNSPSVSTPAIVWGDSAGYLSGALMNADNQGWSAGASVIVVGKVTAGSRSISAAGTFNASGADYAEYMVKAGDFTIAKGDVVGVNADGKLTNVFSNSIAFVVKSTDPSYVGGDNWGNKEILGVNRPEEPTADASDEEKAQYALAKQAFDIAFELAREEVDRIAFSGQVPVNVIGAAAGHYIVPTDDNGAIKGVAVSNPTFEQYQQAVGKVIAIEADGRARIIVKVA